MGRAYLCSFHHAMFKTYFPILQWLPNYKRSYLAGDIGAGITVGIMLVPQGMAYAMIAGLPPVFGLYAALLPQMVYALMGTSRQLAVGPVAMDSLLVAAGLGALSLSGIEEYIGMAIFLALFMGAIQLVLGLLKMGFLVNFLSKPVISGFTSAAAIIIGLSQLKHLLGISLSGSSSLLQMGRQLYEQLHQTHLPTLALGISAILLIMVLKKLHEKIPAALVVVVLGVGMVYFFNLQKMGVAIIGKVPEGLPSFQVPTVPTEHLAALFPMALTLALIAFMEAISVAKAMEEKHGNHTVDANQELLALGTANMVGSLFQSYPTTGGFSRTAVNDQAGARTGVAPLISALVVGLTLLFLTSFFYHLPQTILAAIIMVAIMGLIDIKYPRQLFAHRKEEFYLLVATFLITLTVGIKEGILLGVLISLILLVYRTSRPHMAVLGRVLGTHYFKNVVRFPEDTETYPDFLIVRFDAQLYFGNKDYFKQLLYENIALKGSELRYVILNAEAINYIDSSAVHTLRQLITELKERRITLVIAGAIGPTRDILHASGLVKDLGPEHLFVRTHEAYDHCKQLSKKTLMEEKISLQAKNGTFVT